MLALKHIAINSFNENIVYLNKNCVAYKMDDIRFLTKVEIHGGAAPVYGFLQIIDDDEIVSPEEIGLNTEAFDQLNLPEGANVAISLTPPPQSLSAIRRKIAGNILSPAEYNHQ